MISFVAMAEARVNYATITARPVFVMTHAQTRIQSARSASCRSQGKQRQSKRSLCRLERTPHDETVR